MSSENLNRGDTARVIATGKILVVEMNHPTMSPPLWFVNHSQGYEYNEVERIGGSAPGTPTKKKFTIHQSCEYSIVVELDADASEEDAIAATAEIPMTQWDESWGEKKATPGDSV